MLVSVFLCITFKNNISLKHRQNNVKAPILIIFPGGECPQTPLGSYLLMQIYQPPHIKNARSAPDFVVIGALSYSFWCHWKSMCNEQRIIIYVQRRVRHPMTRYYDTLTMFSALCPPVRQELHVSLSSINAIHMHDMMRDCFKCCL